MLPLFCSPSVPPEKHEKKKKSYNYLYEIFSVMLVSWERKRCVNIRKAFYFNLQRASHIYVQKCYSFPVMRMMSSFYCTEYHFLTRGSWQKIVWPLNNLLLRATDPWPLKCSSRRYKAVLKNVLGWASNLHSEICDVPVVAVVQNMQNMETLLIAAQMPTRIFFWQPCLGICHISIL